MPITTIADALANVGGNISQVMKDEGLRRQQALEAQAQTNELQYRQGLLGLEAQKATAAGQVGLAKAGAEARQFDVTSGQRDTEIAQTGWFQRQQAADAGQRTVIAGKTQAEDVLYHRGQEAIGRANAAAAAQQAQAHMIAARAQANESAERAASEKLKREEYNRPVALEDVYDTFLNTVPDGMSPQQHAYETDLRKSFLASTLGDIRDYAWDETTQKHYGPAGRVAELGKVTQKFLETTKTKDLVSEEALQKQIVDLAKDQEKQGFRGGDLNSNLPIIGAHVRYPTQMLGIDQQIDAKEKEWTKKAIDKFRQNNKGTFGGLMSDQEIYAHKDFKAFLKREVDPFVFQAHQEAARQMLSSKGQAPFVPPWKTEAPPPPPGTPEPVAPPTPGASPTQAAPAAAPGAPVAAPAATPPRFVLPEGGVPTYQPPSTPPPGVDIYGAVGRVLSPLFTGPERGYKTPAVAPTDMAGPPVAVDTRGPIGLAVETALSGGATRESIHQALAGTRDGIYEVRVGRHAYRVVIQDGQIAQMGPAGP